MTMDAQSIATERMITAILLISCGLVFTVGGIMFTGRAFAKWPAGQTPGFLRWERGCVVAGLLLNALGFTLLEGMLEAAGAPVIPRLALVTTLIAAAVLLVAEMTFLHNREWVYSQIVLYVVLAFLAQAAFGAALLQTDLTPAWVGWATILWNIAWLIVLAIASRGNMYFPVLHHVMPLVIGIALLAGR